MAPSLITYPHLTVLKTVRIRKMITFSYNPLSRGGELDKGNMEGFVPLPPPFVHPKMASLFNSLALG